MQPAVLHIALSPKTGPWTVIRELSSAQRASRCYSAVAVGVLATPDWPDFYRRQFRKLPITFYDEQMRKPGILQYLRNLTRRSIVNSWARSLADEVAASSVHIHFHDGWISGSLIPVKPIEGLPTSMTATIHGISGAKDLRRQPVRRLIHRYLARRLDRSTATITTVDQGSMATASELLGLSTDQVIHVPNGARPSLDIRSRLGTSRRPFTIAHVGTLNSDKGWRIAADATLRLAAAGHSIRLILAGGGEQESQAAEMARQFPDTIEFLGTVDNPIQSVFAQSDLFVLMTNNDALPMAAVEALSCGLPIIATAVGDLPYLINCGQAGIICQRNADALASALLEVVLDEEKYKAMESGSRRRFESEFDIQRIANQYDSIYRSAQQRHRST